MPEFLESTIVEINRVLKIGGVVVLTTRNNEDLKKLHVHCPDCGGTFHRVQHVNTFSPNDIEKLMSKFGFETIVCKSAKLVADKGSSWGINFLRKVYHLFRPLPESAKVNLIYIGRKIN